MNDAIDNEEFTEFLRGICNKRSISVLRNKKLLNEISTEEYLKYKKEIDFLLNVLNKVDVISEIERLIRLVVSTCNLSSSEASWVTNVISDIINQNNRYLSEHNTQKKAIEKDLYSLANQGNRKAQYEIGMSCTNYNEAVKWITKAAKQGLAEAQFQLGNRYKTGIGIAKDISKAKEWYKKAADQGHKIAGMKLKDIEKSKGENLFTNEIDQTHESKNTSNFSENNFIKSLKSLTKEELYSLARQGNLQAQYYLGLQCKDSKEAMRWIENAAEQGLAEAQFNLGNRYKLGISVEKDIVKSVQWFTEAANQGHKNSQKKLDEINGITPRFSNARNVVNKKLANNNSIKSKLIKKFEEIFGFIPEDYYAPRVNNAKEIICQGKYKKDDIIDIADTSISSNGKSGLVLTVDSVCVKDLANYTHKFIAKYQDIDYTCMNEDNFLGMDITCLEVHMKFGTKYQISIDGRNKDKLKDFIDYATSLYQEDEELDWDKM